MKRAILTSFGHLTSNGYTLVKLSDELPFYNEIFETAMSLYLNLTISSN
jgi:hypothetical protein